LKKQWLKVVFLLAAILCIAENPAIAGTLTDLGYPNGLILQGASASQDVYFPLPAGTKGAVLNVDFTASQALDPHSSIIIAVDGVPLASLPDATAGKPTQIAIPARFTQGAFLEVSFTADQMIDPDARCTEDTGPAVWSSIAPDTALTPNSTAPQGVGALWRNLGTPLTIALPASPSRADIQTALILSTALVERGIAPYFDSNPAGAQISIDPKAAALQALVSANEPAQIIVPNAAAAIALAAADAALRNVPSGTASGVFTPVSAPAQNIVTLGALGTPSANLMVGQDARLTLALPLANLPVGKHAKAIILYGRGAALPVGSTEIVSLEIGGDVIWSQAFAGAVALNGVEVDLPDRLISAGAVPVLHIIRLEPSDGCAHVTPLPFTLQNNTALKLADGNPSPTRFSAFTAAGNLPVQVLTDLPGSALPPALPLLAELLGAAGVNPVAVTVGDTSAAPSGPFILVSHAPGSVVTVAPIPAPGGALTLSLPNQAAQVVLPESAADSLLQLVSAGQGAAQIPGLWLSPGTPASLAQAALPGDGNVAVYDGSTTPATFLTVLHDAQFVTPSHDFAQFVINNWSTELFAAFWLFATIMAMVIFVRRRRAGK